MSIDPGVRKGSKDSYIKGINFIRYFLLLLLVNTCVTQGNLYLVVFTTFPARSYKACNDSFIYSFTHLFSLFFLIYS